MTKEFKEFIDKFIFNEMWDWEGSTVYGSDLPYKLTEEINRVGNYLDYSQDEAFRFMTTYQQDAAATFDYYSNELDMRFNVFEDPCQFMVLMIIFGTESRLYLSKTVEDNWNKEIELNNTNINRILNDIGITGE